jgi:Tol biopolymer transport system component
LAFVGAGSDRARSQIFVRPINALSEQALAGTEGAFTPFWSPDSRFIGFFTQDGKVKKIDASGGPATTICDIAILGFVSGGTWNQDDMMLFGSTQGIQRVSASGGIPQPIVKGAGGSGVNALLPWFLPDSRSFLFRVGSGNNPGGSEIRLAQLDGGESTVIIKDASQAMYSQGHLLFTRNGTLMAQTFDLGRKQVVGEPAAIAEGLETGGGGNSTFSVSTNGVLVYQEGLSSIRTRLAWFDRSGKASGTVASDANYGDLTLSHDARQAAVTIASSANRQNTSSGDVWLFDLVRNVPSRFTFEEKGVATTAIWSADDKTIVFNSSRKGRLDLYRRTLNGKGVDEELLVDDADKIPVSWSPDGNFILYRQASRDGDIDLWVLPTTGAQKPFPFMNTRFGEDMGSFSPDGHWVAFRSNESGRAEIYVAPFPGPGKKVPISSGGADQAGDPHWRGDGREIFYVATDRKLMAVPVNSSGAEVEVGMPKPLFEISSPLGRPLRHYYDVTADGERFLVNLSSQTGEPSPLTLVVNWTARLKH